MLAGMEPIHCHMSKSEWQADMGLQKELHNSNSGSTPRISAKHMPNLQKSDASWCPHQSGNQIFRTSF